MSYNYYYNNQSGSRWGGRGYRPPQQQQWQQEIRIQNEMKVVPYCPSSRLPFPPVHHYAPPLPPPLPPQPPLPPLPPPPSPSPGQGSSYPEVFTSSPISSSGRPNNVKPTEYSECVSKLGTIYDKLEAENSALKDKVSLLEQQRNDRDKEIKAERARVSEKDEVIKGQETELANLRAKIVEMEAACEQQKNEIAQKCGELDTARTKYQEKVDELEKIQSVAAQVGIEDLEKVFTLQNKLEVAEKTIAELQVDCNDLKKVSKCLNEVIDNKEKEMRETKEIMQSEIDQISTERDSQKNKCRKQDEELARVNGKMAELIMTNNTLKEQVGDLTTKLDQELQQKEQILKEEKAYRSNSTIHQLILQEEMGTIATSTVTAGQQRVSERTRSSCTPKAPGQLAEIFVAVATPDATNGNKALKRKSCRKRRCC